MIAVSSCYKNRFSKEENFRRQEIWKVLVKQVFQRYISPKDTVLDLGAGYCEFINVIHATKKYAVDINPDTKKSANKDVTVIQARADDIPKSLDGTIDVVFMSNFLEHLPNREEVLLVLRRVHALLRRGGRVLILQPNIDLVREAYWDFIDHHVALNEKSLREALELAGFQTDIFIKRFLPYTTKGRLPASSLLVRLYLTLPTILRPLAGQSFVVAHKP